MPDQTPDSGNETVRTDLVQRYADDLAQQVSAALNQGISEEHRAMRALLKPFIAVLNASFAEHGLSKDEIAAIGKLFARNLIKEGIFVTSSTSSDQDRKSET